MEWYLAPSPVFQEEDFAYAAFFAARMFTQRALCAAAIFLRAAGDMVRFGVDELVVLVAGFDPFLIFAQRAFWASAIFRREAAEITRLFGAALCVLFKDSIPIII